MATRPNYAVVLALLMASGMGCFYFSLLLPRARALRVAAHAAGGHEYGGDLYPIWLTGRELLQHRRNPYTPEMTREIQIGLYGRPLDAQHPGDPAPQYRAFAYPLYVELLALPLLPCTFRTIQIALTFVLPVIAAGNVLLWMQALRISLPRRMSAIWILLTLFSYPVLEGLYAQQPSLFVGAGLAAAMWAITRGRLAIGGTLLALCSVKPQLILLLAAWLLIWSVTDWGRRRNFIFGFMFTMIALLLASQIVLPGWFGGWWHSLLDYRRYDLTEPPLAQTVFGKYLGQAVALFLLVLAVFVGWRTRRELGSSSGLTFAAAFLLAVTITTLSGGGAVYDQAVLTPAVLWLYSRRREILSVSMPVRWIAVLTCGVLFWQWIAAGVLAAGSFLFPGRVRSEFILLPVRTAASFPLVLLAMMSFFVAGMLRGPTPTLHRTPTLRSAD